MKQPGKSWFGLVSLLAIFVFAATVARARDAAFMDPAVAGANRVDEAIRVEPKGDIDVGETVLNVAKHITLFFVNNTTIAVHIDKLALNNDGNVTAEISNDDCSKQGTLTPQSRCSVEVAVTPISPGPWNVEVLMTHNAAGRLARAKLSGKTSGLSDQKKDNGLMLSNKDSGTINFGDVDIDGGKVVRSALMSNDSPDPLSIYSIDVIEAGNGLTRLDQGCAIDMELKPGESCPVTLVWTPVARGQISTDLIIRHSGRMGFAVIPIRGTAKGGDGKSAKSEGRNTDDDTQTRLTSTTSLPPPLSASDLAKAVNDMPAVSSETLMAPAASVSSKPLRLIGTVGSRAVLIKADGTTTVVSTGDDLDTGDHTVHVSAVNPKSVEIVDGGKRRTLTLESAQELVNKAVSKVKATAMDGKADAGYPTTNNLLPPATYGGVASSTMPYNAPPPIPVNGVAR